MSSGFLQSVRETALDHHHQLRIWMEDKNLKTVESWQP
jgi:hypothetical protein